MFNKTGGWGLASLGGSFTPLDSRQDSPAAKADAQRLKAELPHYLTPCSPKIAAMRPRISVPANKRGNVLCLAPAAVSDPNAYRRVFQNSTWFRANPARLAGHENLLSVLEVIAGSGVAEPMSGMASGERPLSRLAGVPMVTLSHVVHAIASERNLDCHALASALRTLRTFDLEDALGRAQRGSVPELRHQRQFPCAANVAGKPPGHSDQHNAWLIAYRLGSSAEGLRLLKDICAQDRRTDASGPDIAVDAALAAEKDQLMATFMTAGNALASIEASNNMSNERAMSGGTSVMTAGTVAKARSSVDPASLLARAAATETNAGTLSLLDKAFAALGHRFAQLDVPDAERTEVPHAWAITAVDNGFFTYDSMKAPAARLEKLATKWIDRATPKEMLGKRLASAWKTGKFGFRFFNPYQKKSPFHALGKTAGRDGINFGTADQSVLGKNRSMAAAIESLIGSLEQREACDHALLKEPPHGKINALPRHAGLRQRRAPQHDESGSLFKKTPLYGTHGIHGTLEQRASIRNLVRLEVLRFWSASNQFLHLTDEKRIAEHDLKKIVETLCERLMPCVMQAGLNEADFLKMVHDMFNAENLRLQPETLGDLAREIQEPGKARKTLQLLEHPRTGIAKPTLMKQFSRANLIDTLCTLLDRMDKGSRVNLSSGGIMGAGLKGTAATISRIFSGWIFRTRVDARYEEARQAVCELGVMTHGVEMLVGTQKIKRKQAGFGFFAGAELASSALLGVGGDVAISRETSSTNAVLLRFPRPRAGLPEMNQTVNDFKDVIKFVLKERLENPMLPPGEEDNLFIRLFKRFPDLSIGQKGSSTPSNATTGFKASFVGGAILKAGIYRAGASVTAEAEHRRFHDYRYFEKTGRVRIERFTNGRATSVNVAAGINAASLAVGITGFKGRADRRSINEGGGADSIRWTQGTPNLDVVHINADIYKRGLASRTTLITEAGEVNERSSMVKIHTSARHFSKAIRTRLEHWTDCMTRRWHPEAYARGGIERQTVLAQERAKISQFLDGVVQNAEPTQTFQEHLEIRPEARRELTALYELARHACKGSAKEYQRIIQARINSEDSWEPAHLVAYDGTMSQQSTRLDMLLKIGTLHNKGSTRIVKII
jgi:hypothetical protein